MDDFLGSSETHYVKLQQVKNKIVSSKAIKVCTAESDIRGKEDRGACWVRS